MTIADICIAANTWRRVYLRMVEPAGAMQTATHIVSQPISIETGGDTLIWTPAPGEEWVSVTAQAVIVTWSGTATTQPVVRVLAGEAGAFNALTLAASYNPAIDGGVIMSGGAAPVARRRFTTAAPLKLRVETAAVGATGTISVAIQLIRVK